MGTVNVSAISAALQTEFDSEIVSQINRSGPLLPLLGTKQYRGQNITWDVRTGSASAGSGAAIAEGTDVSTYNNDTKVPAVLQYATMHEAIEVTGLALAAAANSSQPEALVDLFQEEITSAAERLGHSIAVEYYTGTGASNRMTGLGTSSGLALGTAGTYAGLARGTYTQWASNVISNGGTARALSLSLMRQAMREAFLDSGMRPDVIVCDPVQFDKYQALFDSQKQYVYDVRTMGGTVSLEGNFRALEFEGRFLVEDPNCPAGKIFFLNSRRVHLATLSPVGPMGSGAGSIEAPSVVDGNRVSSGLQVKIQPLAVNGDKYRFGLFAYVQPVVRQPNSCAVLEDLITT